MGCFQSGQVSSNGFKDFIGCIVEVEFYWPICKKKIENLLL